jgi:hypothetical protein
MEQKYITKHLIKCIKNEEPVKFLKFGDGEFWCVQTCEGSNCDKDNYSVDKSTQLLKSFKFFADETDNSYIGCWHDINFTSFWSNIVNNKINWVNYHSIIIGDDDFKNQDILNDKIELLKSIKESNLKKIIVCNDLLVKSQILLNIDHVINVPFRNWYDTEFQNILEKTKNMVDIEEKFIFITCCGMSAKILIAELAKIYKNGIYLDFGSALDLLCTKKDSRGREYTYEKLLEITKDIIPENWNDPKYNYIYGISQIELGLYVGIYQNYDINYIMNNAMFLKNKYLLLKNNDDFNIKIYFINNENYLIYIENINNTGWDEDVNICIFDIDNDTLSDFVNIGKNDTHIKHFMVQTKFITIDYTNEKPVSTDFIIDERFFKEHYPYWNLYLNLYSKNKLENIKKINDTNKFCVIIEPRKHFQLLPVIRNFMSLLKTWGLIIYHGTENEDFVKEKCKEYDNIYFENLNVSNLTINDYSNLLSESNFYLHIKEKYNCSHILLFQVDTLLFKGEDDINNFLKYDYVGAPWIWANTPPVGNGGLSLRNIDKMIYITKNFKNNKECPVPEDIFICFKCYENNFIMPDIYTAGLFSSEGIYNSESCGVHGFFLKNNLNYRILRCLKEY